MVRFNTPSADHHDPGQKHFFPGVQTWLAHRLLSCREFSFADHWRVAGRLEHVADVFLDTASLPIWWPQLDVVDLGESGNELGLSRKFAARLRGFLPYTLQVEFHVVRVRYPEEFAVELSGDLVGCGGGSLRQEGTDVRIDFTSRLAVGHPLLQLLSVAARPLLVAQHQWVFKQGERGLVRALDQRRLAESPVL